MVGLREDSWEYVPFRLVPNETKIPTELGLCKQLYFYNLQSLSRSDETGGPYQIRNVAVAGFPQLASVQTLSRIIQLT